MHSVHVRHLFAMSLLVLMTVVSFGGLTPSNVLARQDEASSTANPCGATPPAQASPAMGHGDMGMGTAGASPTTTAEFDHLFIDMMIPHHASVVVLAQAALPRLSDSRLIAMAENIIEAQTAEEVELRDYRESFYGSPDSAPLTMDTMNQMMTAMPGMGPAMDSMQNQMSAGWQVATFCASANPELAFIDQVIPHHQMAVAASQSAVQQAVHPEIATFARRVIDAQNREIEQLRIIRAELTSGATPAT